MSKYLRERQILKAQIRRFFDERAFLEIDTPQLVKMPGAEVHLDYFATDWIDHRKGAHTWYLRSSPEIHMKRAIALGYGSIYQFASSFRNHGEYSDWHHPEFTMLEWYEVGASFDRLIELTKEFVSYLAGCWKKTVTMSEIRVLSIKDVFLEITGINPFASDFLEKSKAAKLTNINQSDDNESAFFKLMLDVIEPSLKNVPVCLLYGYPSSTASLAEVENNVAQRVELYLNGIEAGNGFKELTGTKQNRQRIDDINKERAKLGKPCPPNDIDFLTSMDQVGRCAGNAIGFDRLLAWLLDLDSIRDIVPFGEDFID